MGPHIQPRVGNFLLMGLVGGLGALALVAVAAFVADKNIPIVSDVADASLDVLRKGAAAQ